MLPAVADAPAVITAAVAAVAAAAATALVDAAAVAAAPAGTGPCGGDVATDPLAGGGKGYAHITGTPGSCMRNVCLKASYDAGPLTLIRSEWTHSSVGKWYSSNGASSNAKACRTHSFSAAKAAGMRRRRPLRDSHMRTSTSGRGGQPAPWPITSSKATSCGKVPCPEEEAVAPSSALPASPAPPSSAEVMMAARALRAASRFFARLFF